ncbi:hypothetical protein ACFQGE_07430 [Halomicroarcula sp. GCM10025817]|uniref:hypothetical protein n=1 Tax=Haloarcula TaxID=2237 RepID=UPI0023E84602|nr:hypothetical protein [Halomicroarcula sp. SYNS111]
MTEPSETVGAETEPLADGYVSLEYEPIGGGQMRIAAYANGDVLESGKYSTKIFGSATLRGQFLNSVEKSLEGRNGVDAGEVRQELKEWFAAMNELDREEQAEKFLPDEIRRIIDGTHYPVEIHGGETTTWKVKLTYAGRTRELEFSASEMVGGGAGALQEKIANQFFELIEIEPEDWEAIRERWHEDSEVVNVVEETASDAIADRVLSKLGNTLKPVGDREDMGNDVAAAWFDEENATVYDDAPPDEPIVWVQDDFLVDQLEAAGKNLEYKGQLIQDLIARGDVYGSRARKKWAWDSRTKIYPFDPDALGVTPDDVGGSDDPNHSEVSA